MDYRKAEELCKGLMVEHGVSDFAFAWMNSARIFGQCQFGRRIALRNSRAGHRAPVLATAPGGTIRLSRQLVLLNDEEAVRDTILHEIAHAKVGPRHGHGEVWMKMASKLGARPERCYEDGVKRPPHTWEMVCRFHGVVARRMRRTKARQACTTCCRLHNHGRFDSAYLLGWRRANP